MNMKRLPLFVLTTGLIAAAGCATIKIGGDRTPRYDQDGNEVVFIANINVSRLSELVASKGAVMNGAAVGSGVGSGLASVGAKPGMLAGGAIAGAAKAIKDSGKLEVNVVDFDAGTEVKQSKRGWDSILRTPWEGWEGLRPQTWARLMKDVDGYYVVPCNPACLPIADATRAVTSLPKEKQMWVFIDGSKEFRVPKSIPVSVAEKIAPQWPAELGAELLQRVRERDGGGSAVSAKN
jgi:hypothetical protein